MFDCVSVSAHVCVCMHNGCIYVRWYIYSSIHCIIFTLHSTVSPGVWLINHATSNSPLTLPFLAPPPNRNRNVYHQYPYSSIYSSILSYSRKLLSLFIMLPPPPPFPLFSFFLAYFFEFIDIATRVFFSERNVMNEKNSEKCTLKEN